jgi:YfiH family protein
VSITVELTNATVLFTGRAEGDLGLTSEPPRADVAAHRADLLERLSLDGVRGAQQVHGAVVTLAEPTTGYVVGPATADGLVTSSRDIALAVHVADCLPVAIAGAGGVAVVHAGWRGLAGGLIGEAVRALRALDVGGPLEAAIGPGALGCCYEAGPELHDLFATYGASRDRRLDLPAIAGAQLAKAGVTAITNVGICTLCAPPGLLFSHRRDGAATGRQAGLAWLR